MKSLLLFLFTFGTLNLHAAITLNNTVTGASNYDFIVNNTNSSDELAPIIYGGLAGNDCSLADNTTTCNSCEGITNASSDMSCNQNRIHGNLILTIYYTSNSTTGFPAASVADADNTSIPYDIPNSSGNTTAGTQAYISLRWDSICQAIAGSSCSAINGVVYQNVNIGISPTNDQSIDSGDDFVKIKFIISNPQGGNIDGNPGCSTGVCSLEVFPGDQKVYIEKLELSSSFPAVSSSVGLLKFSRMRIMYSTDPNTALPSGTYTDLNIVSNGDDVTPDLVDGLNNGETYYFRFGSIDDAGNLTSVSSGTVSAQPSPTAGLLTEDINCFIATAAFGSTLNSHVQSLRVFRNKYLLNSKFGQYIVKLYYNYSPAMAEKIHRSEILKFLAKALVWPLVFWVESGFKFGFLLVNGLIVMTILLSAFGFILFRRKLC